MAAGENMGIFFTTLGEFAEALNCLPVRVLSAGLSFATAVWRVLFDPNRISNAANTARRLLG